MPSPKDGKTGTPVSPTEPTAALEADKTDPGLMEKIKAEQKQTQTGKYGSTSLQPHRRPSTDSTDKEEVKKHWIEIELLDDKKKPVAGERYRIVLADGTTAAEGTLDEKGFARVDGIDPGSCTVTFPKRHKACWDQK
jgi:hypothetical protein